MQLPLKYFATTVWIHLSFIMLAFFFGLRILPCQYLFRRLAVIFFCHICIKIALPVSVLTFSTPADFYLRFPYLRIPPKQSDTYIFDTCIFHPCQFVLMFSVLVYSIPCYLRCPYLHFQSPKSNRLPYSYVKFTSQFTKNKKEERRASTNSVGLQGHVIKQ